MSKAPARVVYGKPLPILALCIKDEVWATDQFIEDQKSTHDYVHDHILSKSATEGS